MSGYILCQTKKAKTPYFIENISTNIYSLEELCYYLYHNLYLVDRSIINEGLCTWISEELALPRLAAKIKPHLGKFASMEDVLYPIFKEINYLSYEELRVLNGKLARLDVEAPLLREKRKGDALVENGMYVNAIRVYQNLLRRDGLEAAREGLTESIYHNLGCAYSYLFQMEKAVECFEKAYELGKSQEALKCFLLAFRSVKTPIEYESKLTELAVSADQKEEISQTLEKFAKKPETPVYSQHIDEMLEQFTRDYHRSTGS